MIRRATTTTTIVTIKKKQKNTSRSAGSNAEREREGVYDEHWPAEENRGGGLASIYKPGATVGKPKSKQMIQWEPEKTWLSPRRKVVFNGGPGREGGIYGFLKISTDNQSP